MAVDNCSIAKLFKYEEYWVLNRTHGEMFEDVHTVSMDYEEPYNPNRVTMQFGLYQLRSCGIGFAGKYRSSYGHVQFFRPLSNGEWLYIH